MFSNIVSGVYIIPYPMISKHLGSFSIVEEEGKDLKEKGKGKARNGREKGEMEGIRGKDKGKGWESEGEDHLKLGKAYDF